MRAALVVLAACSAPAAPPSIAQRAPELPPLPRPAAIDTVAFTSMLVCERCHVASPRAMRDLAGRDISPYTELQSSMMGLAARDPYVLAAIRRELAARPGHATEAVCLRCHAAVGYAEDPRLTLDDVEHGTSPAAALARDGAGCLGCHALEPGTDLVLRRDRVTYGALPEPLVDAMVAMSKTRPVPGKHVLESTLCATCHAVTIDGFLEQATSLEWAASDYGATPCQSCHQPSGDPETNDPSPIATPFSTRPPDAPSRDDYRHHTLRGGNAFLLDALAKSAAWLGASDAEALRAAARSTKHFLTTAAELELAATPEGAHVTVLNRTGHKLPTGFPTRRMWLHLVAVDAQGAIVFESGSHRRGAVLVGGRGVRLDLPGVILPHRTRITQIDQLAIWEAVPVDSAGKPTHLLFAARRFAKDDRILPRGYRPDPRTDPVGVEGDADFAPGRDGVDYVLPRSAVRAEVELLYQTVPPETLESYRASDSPEAARFLAIAGVPAPEILAFGTLKLQPAR